MKNPDAEDFKMLGMIILVIFLLLIMNTAEIMSLWIYGKSREIFVKKMVGIPSTYIYVSLFFNFLCLMVLSNLAGITGAFLFSFPANTLLSVKINVPFCLFSFLICTCTGAIFGVLIYLNKVKHGFMELK